MTIVKYRLPKMIKENLKLLMIVTHTPSISTIANPIFEMGSGRIVEKIENPHPVSAAFVEW